VEDNEADMFLIEEAIAAAQLSVAVHVVRNGQQAIRFFDRAGHAPNSPCPALVILDINLPRRPGYEVLKRSARVRDLERLTSCCIDVGCAER
jgi:two-component system, chemotaxis family, response regulator Rcp1